jgi:hypothetical protein
VADIDDLQKIWEDQASFNRQIRPDPSTFEAKSMVTSELVLAATDELHELLRTTKWKKHRQPRRYEVNLAHTTEELVDVFKDFIGLCQTWNVSPQQLIEGYWAKSAVNRQRYSEEWVEHHIDGPVILLDLDNVLCDYIDGFGRWLMAWYAGRPFIEEVHKRVLNRQWIDAKTIRVNDQWFEGVKHEFRCGGFKRNLPVMPGAKEFVDWCRHRAMVILLTARPIDRYPNMLTDTVYWLNQNNIRVSHIWWGADKGKVVQLESIQKNVIFAVDDVLGHCHEYQDHGIESYWLGGSGHGEELITPVKSFDEIMQREDKYARVQR